MPDGDLREEIGRLDGRLTAVEMARSEQHTSFERVHERLDVITAGVSDMNASVASVASQVNQLQQMRVSVERLTEDKHSTPCPALTSAVQAEKDRTNRGFQIITVIVAVLAIVATVYSSQKDSASEHYEPTVERRKPVAGSVSWGTSSAGCVSSKCGRFTISPLYNGRARPQSYKIADTVSGETRTTRTQTECKALAEKMVVDAATEGGEVLVVGEGGG